MCLMNYRKPYQNTLLHTGNQDFLHLTHLTRLLEKLVITTSPHMDFILLFMYRLVYFLHEITSLQKAGKNLRNEHGSHKT